MDKKEKSFLLGLARNAILAKLERREFSVDRVDSSLKEKRSCFVTLTLDGELRGCIGHLEAFEPLYLNVINNAVNAAFFDSRFPPLSADEFPKIKIEISVLSSPERLVFLNSDDLLNKLSGDEGVILKKGSAQATFLPQVWDVFPDKVLFLENLCEKAGLYKDAWKEYPEVFVYGVDKFSE